jgi:hypothetical protein
MRKLDNENQRHAGHSTLFNVDVWNEWSFALTLHVPLYCKQKVNF